MQSHRGLFIFLKKIKIFVDILKHRCYYNIKNRDIQIEVI